MSLLTHKPQVRDTEWYIVECQRLGTILSNMIKERNELRQENARLQQMLGQAEAGMEMADLIKRMIHI